MSKLNDITGKRFGRLVAIKFERVFYANRLQVLWTCKCDCGKYIRAASHALKRGNPKSCGCWNSEDTSRRNMVHGKRRTPTYYVWAAMKSRCTNPNNIGFANYGGRGITVCERWSNSFESFLNDMGERPTDKHQIDRIDNNGNYEPANCRWAARSTQCWNKRNNHKITCNGKTMTINEWSQETGISPAILRRRIHLGWSHHRTVTTPTRR